MIVVRQPGLLTTVQDLGRPGWAHLGVPLAGAVDRAALRAANRIVGNADTAAVLETTLAGPELIFDRASVVAVTGGRCEVTLDGQVVELGAPASVPAGGHLSLGPVTVGVRSYLAVRGGFDIEPVLGSRSTCTLSGLGPPPLQARDVLRVGLEVADAVGVELLPAIDAEPVLRVVLGPRDDAFVDPSVLLTSSYAVTASSDRTGVRLDGPPLRLRSTLELPSEGVVPGAVQVPPDGRPIVFLANCPTTGGYPVVGVVVEQDLRHAAQARPGTTIRFTARASDAGRYAPLGSRDAR